MVKKFFIFSLLLYLIPLNTKVNRFENIFISPIGEIETINFSYIVAKKEEVFFNIYIEYQNGRTKDLYKLSHTFDQMFSDKFLIFLHYVEENSSLVFTARGGNFSSYIKFCLYKQEEYKNLNECTTFYQEAIYQYIDEREVVHFANEKITFKEVVNLVLINKPYLDFNLLFFEQFSYFYQQQITYDDIFLRIEDKDNVFPLLPHENTYVYFPLILKKTNDIYSLELSDKLYVNEQLLLLSKENKEGFKRTNYLYVPKNKKIDEINGLIVFKGLGLQKLNVFFNYRYLLTKNFIGCCSSSYHCLMIDQAN